MRNIEGKILSECNQLLSKYGFTAKKVKIKRTYSYQIVKGDRNILGNEDIIAFSEFCKDENNLVILASIYNQ